MSAIANYTYKTVERVVKEEVKTITSYTLNLTPREAALVRYLLSHCNGRPEVRGSTYEQLAEVIDPRHTIQPSLGNLKLVDLCSGEVIEALLKIPHRT